MINNSGTAIVQAGFSGTVGPIVTGTSAGASGTLLIDGGFLQTNLTTLGSVALGSGDLVVQSGTFSAGNITVGNSGSGSLLISGGLLLSSGLSVVGGNAGSVTLSSGTWNPGGVTLGSQGAATLLIEGGVLSTTGNIAVASGAHSSSSITMNAGALSARVLTIGSSGTGTMQLNGGLVSGTSVNIGSGTNRDSTLGNANTVTVTVTGEGSQWIISDTLTVGDYGSDNTLTMKEHALVQIGHTDDRSLIFSNQGGVATGNLLQIDGGYIALFGDQSNYVDSLLCQGYIEIWDGTGWVAATAETFAATYYATEEGAEAATGYSGLGNYTVLTTIPEPGSCALLALGATALWLAKRRRATPGG